MNQEALFKITYGLYIVSSGDGPQMTGHISNTVFQVTANPVRFTVASNKDNLTTDFIHKSGSFSISVLQQDVDLDFLGPWGFKSGKDINKFESVNYKIGQTGTPIVLEKCIAYFECKLLETIDTGTHLLFIGEVLDMDVINNEAPPLTYEYYRRVIKGISPKNAPTYISDHHEKDAPEKLAGEGSKQLYQCTVCGLIYDPDEGDPDSGIPPGTAFEDIPNNWTCPVCGVTKDDFRPI